LRRPKSETENSQFEIRNSKFLFIVPGDIQRQTGGSLYDRKLAESLTERGFCVELASVPDLPYFAGLLAGLVISPWLLFRIANTPHEVVLLDGWAHPTTLLFNLVFRLFAETRVVVIVHQIRWREMKAPARLICRMAETLMLRSAHLIVSVSGFIGGEVERLVGSHKQIVVARPGSVPLSNMISERGDRATTVLRLLFVGNCVHLKGLEHLIAAVGLLRDVELSLDLVGDVGIEPRYYDRLIKQVHALNLSDRVTFHGAIPHEDLGDFYSRADIFTFPSLYEGFGMVLTEAMHSGLPIVATRTGPISEILREGENALIVPLADSAALAESIRRLAGDAGLRRDFGRRSRELALLLPTWSQTCNDVCDQIELICQKTPGKKQSMKRTPTQSP